MSDSKDFFKKGNSFYKDGGYQKAIENYTKAIEIDPKNAKAYNNRGNAYSRLRKYKEAIENYTKAIEIDPKNAKAYYNRGIAYKGLEKYDNAIEYKNKEKNYSPEILKAGLIFFICVIVLLIIFGCIYQYIENYIEIMTISEICLGVLLGSSISLIADSFIEQYSINKNNSHLKESMDNLPEKIAKELTDKPIQE